MNQLQTFLSFLTKEILTRSEFIPEISHNRINNIVKNNLTKIMDEKKVTTLRHNTDLAIVAKNLNMFISQEDFNEGEIKTYLKEDETSLTSSTCNEMITVIADKLKDVKKELNNIHTVGSSLIEKVDILFKKYNLNPPGTSSYKELALMYEDWKDVGYLGPEDTIIEELNNHLNKERDDISLTVYFNFMSKIKNDHSIQTKDFKSCIIPEEKKEKIVQAISTYSGLSLQNCKDMLSIVLDKNGLNRLLSSMEVNSGLTVQKFNQLTDLLVKLHKFQNAYDRKITSQKEEDLFIDNEMVKYNLTNFESIKKALIYIKSYYRYQHWQNFIILPTGKINNDLLEKAQAVGIEKDTLRLFVSRTDFSKAVFFSIDVINKQKENYLAAQVKDEDKRRLEVLTNEKGARQLAIQTVLKYYFQSKKINNAFDLSTAFAREAINLNQPNDFVIYKAVIQREVENNWTKEIFDELGEEFAKLSNQAENINTRMVQEVQGGVAAKKIITFLADNYC